MSPDRATSLFLCATWLGVVVLASGGSRTLASVPTGETSSAPGTLKNGSQVTRNATAQIAVAADARNLTLTDVVRLPFPGKHPAFSPNGEEVLYNISESNPPGAKAGRSSWNIWVMHADGSGRQRLILDGVDGAWSPDGRKIAYWSLEPSDQPRAVGKTIRGVLALFDRGARKRIILLTVQEPGYRMGGRGSIVWSKDGSSIFLLGGDPLVFGDAAEVNLETLAITWAPAEALRGADGSLSRLAQRRWLEEHVGEYNFANIAQVSFASSLEVWSWRVEGLWVYNNDESFRKLLMEGRCGGIAVSPNGTRMAFEFADPKPSPGSGNAALVLATLARMENVPSRSFAVDLSKASFNEQIENMGPAFGAETGTALERCTAADLNIVGPGLARTSGPARILAEARGGKLNPLNGKTVGPNDDFKGIVELVGVTDDHPEARVIVERAVIRPGDVITGAWFGDLGENGVLQAVNKGNTPCRMSKGFWALVK